MKYKNRLNLGMFAGFLVLIVGYCLFPEEATKQLFGSLLISIGIFLVGLTALELGGLK